MAINYPGPGELRLFYVTNEDPKINEHVFRHSFKFDADPPTLGLGFSQYDAIQRGGGTIDLETWTDDLVALLQPLFNTAVDISHAELWYYDAGTFDSIFVSTLPIAENGTAGGATVPMSQAIVTFRSQFGGIAKIDLRGTTLAASAKQGFPTSNTQINALATALTGSTSIMIARDDGFTFAPVKLLPGSNERAFKKLFR